MTIRRQPLGLDPDFQDSRRIDSLRPKLGYPVKKDMPDLKGSEVEALYATGADWLAGKQIAWSGHSWGG